MHLDAGHQVWLVTAAPVEVAGIIAGRLGMTGALGSLAEREDGVYTGRLDGRAAARTGQGRGGPPLAERHGFDLAHCYAYSDSANDLPLLSLVGHPCAINPDRRLRQHADGARLADPRLPHRPEGDARRAGQRRHGRRCSRPAWPSGAAQGGSS